jgi:DNA polymerase-1
MILLVDLNNMAYRALHVHHLSHKGIDTSVEYGTLRMLAGLIHKYKPESVVACFDGGTPAYRKALLPCYKANRKKDKDDTRDWEDVFRQINTLADHVLPMHGVLVLRRRYIEADDLLYWCAVLSDDLPIVVTADKDLLQACSIPDTRVLNPMTGKLYDSKGFQREFGFPAVHFVHFKVMLGDGSDNVPGVKGIGPVAATKVIHEWLAKRNRLMGNVPIPGNTWDCLNDRQQKSLDTFGMWQACYDVMDLSVDRCGAKYAIHRQKDNWCRAAGAQVKMYYMRNGFASLLQDPDIVPSFKRLVKPRLSLWVSARAPLVVPVRAPVN